MGVVDAATLDVGGPVQAEVLALRLGRDGIELTGPCAAAPWYLQVAADEDPLDLVAEKVAAVLGRPLVVHSTSWRRDRGSVLLTFVAVLGPASRGELDSVPVRRATLARNSATAAPLSVTVAQVIEHGLRHLAWLIRDDAVIAGRLGDRWARALRGYRPEPFRVIGQQGAVAWS